MAHRKATKKDITMAKKGIYPYEYRTTKEVHRIISNSACHMLIAVSPLTLLLEASLLSTIALLQTSSVRDWIDFPNIFTGQDRINPMISRYLTVYSIS